MNQEEAKIPGRSLERSTTVEVRRSTLESALALAIFLAISGLPSKDCLAQMPAGSHEVARAVMNSRVFSESAQLSISISPDKSVIVSTYRNESAADKDCKIDAVLVAKSVIESFPDVVSVRTVYYNPHNRASYRYVDVQRDMLKSFRGGKINDEQMLSALTVGASRVPRASQSTRVELETYEPLKGVYRTERSMVLLKVRSLKDRGGNAESLFQDFLSIERNYIAKDKMEGFANALNALSSKIDAALAQANSRLDKQTASEQGPKPGPFYDRRCAIVRRLRELAVNGTNVSALEKVYKESIESVIGKPGYENTIENSLRFLEGRLRLTR